MLLLTQANAVVPAHQIVDELWGDAPPASAVNLVQGAVSALRKVLGREAIATRGSGYALRVTPEALDLQRFERLAQEGSLALDDGRLDDAARALGEALSLWRGPALADLADELLVQTVASRLDELRLLALERHLEAELRLGRHADVLPGIRALVGDHPLRERLHGLLMLALYRCGRQADALEAYRSARATLVEELGISPGPALQELEGRILRQDPDLLPPTPGRTAIAVAAEEPLRSILVTPLAPRVCRLPARARRAAGAPTEARDRRRRHGDARRRARRAQRRASGAPCGARRAWAGDTCRGLHIHDARGRSRAPGDRA